MLNFCFSCSAVLANTDYLMMRCFFLWRQWQHSPHTAKNTTIVMMDQKEAESVIVLAEVSVSRWAANYLSSRVFCLSVCPLSMLHSIRLPDCEVFHDGCIRYSIKRCELTYRVCRLSFPSLQSLLSPCRWFEDFFFFLSLYVSLWEVMLALRIISKTRSAKSLPRLFR